ncbi:hypothetical protein BDQ12DRAFT_576623, partial [Crucibulum laeve]
MSTYSYNAPASPTFGFFPTGATSPNAFASFHQSPRDTHNMYSSFSSHSNSQQRNGSQPSQSKSGLKK